MNIDFSAVLVLLTFVCGLIWIIDSLFFAKTRVAAIVSDQKKLDKPRLPIIVDYAKSFFPVFLLVLLLRSFLFEPFKIPSGSMMPTLLIGDFILVNKFDYGLRLPVLHYKIWDNKTPKRGDIVVFRYPENPDIPFIKRIVGLPGDRITYFNKTLYVNDVVVPQISRGQYHAVGAGQDADGLSLRLEHLGDGQHDILVDVRRRSQQLAVEVPQDHYFVLGDNRDNSRDSRFWGFVPDANLVGRAFMIWMNWDSKNGGIDFGRIGEQIK